MAEKCAEKLIGIVECPVCLQKLNNPKALQCLHFFCESCIAGLKPVTEASKIGVNCPLCRQFTSNDQLRKMPLMQELLDAVSLAEQEHQPCERCDTEKATWRCLDCKESYCSACRLQHDRFKMFKHHTCEEWSASQRSVIDKHINCAKHPDEWVKLYCQDCDQLICLICKGTAHNSHTAVTIKERLAEILPTIEKQREAIQQNMDVTERVLAETVNSVTKMKESYSQLQTQLKGRYEAVLKRAKEDYERVSRELESCQKKQEVEINKQVESVQLTLKGQKSVLQWSDATLATTHGASLLNAIQSGMLESLTKSAKHKQPISDIPSTIGVRIVDSKDSLVGKVVQDSLVDKVVQDSSVGKIVHQASAPSTHSMLIPRAITSGGSQLKLNKTAETYHDSRRFATVRDQLWSVEYDKAIIHVYDMDLQKLRTLQLRHVGKCRSVLEFRNRVIIAADNGLFTSDYTGHKTCKLVSGTFCDVSIVDVDDHIYALDDNGIVQVLEYNPDRDVYVKQHEIQLARYTSSPRNTIQATHSYVYIAMYDDATILQYDYSGTLLASRGSEGPGVGQLGRPSLCGADIDGALLVADTNNLWFKVLTPDENWSLLNIEGLDFWPHAAIVDNNRFIVKCSGFMKGTFQEYLISPKKV